MYAGAPLSLGALRKRLPNARRPYRLPWAGVIAPASFVIANYLILWSAWYTDWKLGVAILIGYAVLALTQIFRVNDTDIVRDVRAASWLLPYLIGMGVLIYVSDFGVDSSFKVIGPNWIPLWWDLLAVGGFSLIIYYWAMAVALPGEKITETVRKQAIETEELELVEDEPEAAPAGQDIPGLRPETA
jgi:amino acid transporter